MKARSLISRKLQSRAGFTLAELLMVVLILLLVSTVMATGIPAAANAYQKVVDSANAQLLLSTTVSSLERELSLATEVEPNTVDPWYINTTRGHVQQAPDGTPLVEAKYRLTKGEDGDEIKRTWLMDTDNPESIVPEALTIAGKTKGGLVPQFEEYSFDDESGCFTVSGLQVVKKTGSGDGTVMAGPVDLIIRTIAIESQDES